MYMWRHTVTEVNAWTLSRRDQKNPKASRRFQASAATSHKHREEQNQVLQTTILPRTRSNPDAKGQH